MFIFKMIKKAFLWGVILGVAVTTTLFAVYRENPKFREYQAIYWENLNKGASYVAKTLKKSFLP